MQILIRSYSDDLSEVQEFIGSHPGLDIELVQAGNEWSAVFSAKEDFVEGISVGFCLDLPDAIQPYVCIPASIYAGNDFRSFPFPYPCIVSDPADFRADLANTISNVPRLPRIQQLAGDAAMPAIGIGDFTAEKGVWLRTHPGRHDLQPLLEVTKDKGLRASILLPGVRTTERYFGCGEKWVSSTDKAWKPKKGDSISITVFCDEFKAISTHDLFKFLFDKRNDIWPEGGRPELPWSAAFEIQERKYADSNWDPIRRYYAVGDRQSRYAHWQIGWVGGGIASHGLLASKSSDTRQKVIDSINFIVNKGQSPSGFYWSVGIEDEMFSDMVDMEWGHDWHLIRRSGDALYFLCKQINILSESESVPPEWLDSIKKCADAFVKLWKSEGQFGQFVSQETGEIRVGRTASGAIAPAGLALAAQLLKNDDYLETAKQSAEYYLREFLDKGYTSGGPGEASQCPDSESAFGLLESCITLYEVTKNPYWLAESEKAAWHSASWTMPYDFVFPAESTFGRLDMRTTGSVWANAQNKHSAPGICTLSGVSLFKLARAAQNFGYLDLLKQIAHGVTQYLSREDRPVFGMPAGWMCERVNSSDWEDPVTPVGEGFAASCWCEVSSLLTYAEVPGFYIQPDSLTYKMLDSGTAQIIGTEDERVKVEIKNPTKFDMNLSIFSELSTETDQILGQDFLLSCPRLIVPAGESRHLTFCRKSGSLL